MSSVQDQLAPAPARKQSAARPSIVRSSLSSPLTFWLLLAGLCLVRGYVGLYGTRSYAHDGFMVLDGAWRMLNGQRPHVDFNSMVGPVAYLPTLVGLVLTGGSAAGFGWGQSLVAFGLGGWAYALGSGLSAPARSVFALCTAVVAVSPALIGPTPLDISPGMSYNRLSYALLSLLLLDFLTERGPSDLTRGLSSGCLLGLLLFLKMTTFVAGALAVTAFLILRPRTLHFIVVCALTCAAVTLAFLAYLHGHVHDVLRDLALTAAAKRIPFGIIYLYSTIFFETAVALVFVLGAAGWLAEHGRADEARRVRHSGILIAALSCLLVFSNYQHSELPLIPFFIIIVIDQMVARKQGAWNDSGLFMLQCMKTAFLALTFGAAIFALITGVRARLYTVRYAQHLSTPALDAFVPVASDYPYVKFVNDGLAMLKENRLPGEHVMSLDFTNPFSFGLHIPPAAGGTTNIQFHGSFDDQHKLTPDRLFGASELVMLPETPTDPANVDSVVANYGPYLRDHYRLVASDDAWSLYRRNR